MKNSKDLPFSIKDRENWLEKTEGQEYDLIVIGGGITGAGIALDAALRGIKTLLVEKEDFASGTSSKSTKLIHGGLRYLKQFEIKLVRESGQERAVAHANIPHLVHPEKMFLPIVKNGTFGKWSASMAISVYDVLAAVRHKDKKKTLALNAAIDKEPLINKDLLKSGIQYSEYRTDDARLTIELIKAARREGAAALNYMQVDDFEYQDGKVVGVQCIDKLTGLARSFSALQVVSAAGPWVDKLRIINKSKQGKSLRLTKGVHIVVPHEKLPVSSAVYFDAFDGRMLFAIPRGKITYIGTSDTEYDEDLNRVLCTKEDANYIIKAVNKMFEMPDLELKNVISSWAGLRPLIHEVGKSHSELSRKDEIFISESSLVSIAGGKLTGYRKMAKRVIDLIQKRVPLLSQKACVTEDYRIHAEGFDDYETFELYVKELSANYKSDGLSAYDSWYLASTYGRHASSIIRSAIDSKLDLPIGLIQAEIEYGIDYESVCRPADYFVRRSGRLYFDIQSVKENLDFILDVFQSVFGWSAQERNVALVEATQLIKDASEFE